MRLVVLVLFFLLYELTVLPKAIAGLRGPLDDPASNPITEMVVSFLSINASEFESLMRINRCFADYARHKLSKKLAAENVKKLKAGVKDMQSAVLIGADLNGMNLFRVNFTDALLDYSSFLNANLDSSNLRNVRARSVNFTKATLRNARLSFGQFDRSLFVEVDFSGVHAPAARFLESKFIRANFNPTNYSHANFIGSCFQGATFISCVLNPRSGINLRHGNFQSAQFLLSSKLERKVKKLEKEKGN